MHFKIGQLYALTAPLALLTNTEESEKVIKSMTSASSIEMLKSFLIELQHLKNVLESDKLTFIPDHETFFQQTQEVFDLTDEAHAKVFLRRMRSYNHDKPSRAFKLSDEQYEFWQHFKEGPLKKYRNELDPTHKLKGDTDRFSDEAFLIMRKLTRLAQNGVLDKLISLTEEQLNRIDTVNSKFFNKDLMRAASYSSLTTINLQINENYSKSVKELPKNIRYKKYLEDRLSECNAVLDEDNSTANQYSTDNIQYSEKLFRDGNIDEIRDTLAQLELGDLAVPWLAHSNVKTIIAGSVKAIKETVTMYNILSTFTKDNLALMFGLEPDKLDEAIMEIEECGVIGIYTESLLLLNRMFLTDYTVEETKAKNIHKNPVFVENAKMLKMEIESALADKGSVVLMK